MLIKKSWNWLSSLFSKKKKTTLVIQIAKKTCRFFHWFNPILFILLLVFMINHMLLAKGRNSLLRCPQCSASNVLWSEMIKAETKEAPSKESTFYIQSHQLQPLKHKTRDLVGCLHLHFVIYFLQVFFLFVWHNGKCWIKRELLILVGECECFWRKKLGPTWLVPAQSWL